MLCEFAGKYPCRTISVPFSDCFGLPASAKPFDFAQGGGQVVGIPRNDVSVELYFIHYNFVRFCRYYSLAIQFIPSYLFAVILNMVRASAAASHSLIDCASQHCKGVTHYR
jgi:hypothetical protein